MFKAIATNLVSIEPGKVQQQDGGSVSVDTEPLQLLDRPPEGCNCIVMSLESGTNATMTDHAFNFKNAHDAMCGLICSLATVGDPLAISIARFLQIPEKE